MGASILSPQKPQPLPMRMVRRDAIYCARGLAATLARRASEACCFPRLRVGLTSRLNVLLRRQRQREPAAVEEVPHIDVFLDGVHVVLAGAERNGRNAVADKPVGVEPAVAQTQGRLPTEALRGGLG